MYVETRKGKGTNNQPAGSTATNNVSNAVDHRSLKKKKRCVKSHP